MGPDIPRFAKYAIISGNPVPYLFPDCYEFKSITEGRGDIVSIGRVSFCVKTYMQHGLEYTDLIVECAPLKERQFRARPEEDAKIIKKWMLTPEKRSRVSGESKNKVEE